MRLGENKALLPAVILVSGFSFYAGYVLGKYSPEPIDYRVTHREVKQQQLYDLHFPKDFHTKVTRPLLDGLKHVVRGYRHVRSSKAATEFQGAFMLLYNVLKELNTNASDSTNLTLKMNLWGNSSVPKGNTSAFSIVGSQIDTLPDVCPEKWGGTMHGYPFYFKGFDPVDCTTAAPLNDTITVLLQHRGLPFDYLNDTLAGIQANYFGIRVIVAVFDQDTLEKVKGEKYGNLRLEVTLRNTSTSDGEILQTLIPEVKTKYVLLAPNGLTRFDQHSKLSRLIRMINYFPTVHLAAGSFRNGTGHWTYGCYQTVMRNYRYRMVEGYDLSVQTCPYCDYAAGPFVVTTEQLRKVGFSNLWGNFAFLDFFEKWKKAGLNTVVCPDAMFHKTGEHYPFENTDRSHFIPFAKIWELNKIQLRRTTNLLSFTCEELGQACRKDKGLSVPPCCLDTISEMLAFTFDTLAAAGVEAEVEAGTQIGAIKFRGTLPWELDADYNYRASEGGHSKFGSLIPKFKAAGYSVTEERKCNETELSRQIHADCGYYVIRNKYWRFESWGGPRLSHDYFMDEGVPNSTLIELDGKWYRAYPNPVDAMRNEYGDDLFEHVEHWSKLGHSTGWVPYNTGTFIKCPMPGFHGCLDNFLPVGNLQFLSVWL